MEVNPPKRTRKVGKRTRKRRSFASQRFFEIEGERINVCDKFFCKTLSIGRHQLLNAIQNRDSSGNFNKDRDPRGGRAPSNKSSPGKIEEVRNHIRLFLSSQNVGEADAKLTVTQMHSHYVKECRKRNSKPVTPQTYRRIWESLLK